LWLVAQQQSPDFARGLISPLKLQLATTPALRATRTGQRPPGSGEYVVARGTDLGPVGADFGVICDQIDQADAMLAGLRERTREGHGTPEPARLDTGDQPLALARHRHRPRHHVHAARPPAWTPRTPERHPCRQTDPEAEP
jgi:hypothetical protein